MERTRGTQPPPQPRSSSAYNTTSAHSLSLSLSLLPNRPAAAAAAGPAYPISLPPSLPLNGRRLKMCLTLLQLALSPLPLSSLPGAGCGFELEPTVGTANECLSGSTVEQTEIDPRHLIFMTRNGASRVPTPNTVRRRSRASASGRRDAARAGRIESGVRRATRVGTEHAERERERNRQQSCFTREIQTESEQWKEEEGKN